MLPTADKIEKWSDDRLNSVIKSGESLNWKIALTETQEEVDEYVQSLYTERDARLNH